jgi:malate/lactate dehydrogenase
MAALGKIASGTRTAGIEIIGAKGATYYGIGAALFALPTQSCGMRTRVEPSARVHASVDSPKLCHK